MRNRYSEAVAALVLGWSAISCAPVHAGLLISEAWVRAVPPVSSATAGYCRVTNDGDTVVRITGAESPMAGHVMMHDMRRNAEGLRQMAHIEALELAPGESVEFAPGGMHLMIMHMPAVPAPGERMPLCLLVEGAEPACRDFDVKRQP